MIPSAFVFLDAFPLNPNGKVDRRALAAFTPIEEEVHKTSSDTPRDVFEMKLVVIWRDLLRLKHVGIHDDFFNLGGHSLLAVRLFARIERDFGIRLPLTTLFHAATISNLANLLREPGGDSDKQSVVVHIRFGNGKPILFGVHGHEGGVLFWRDIVMHLPPDQPFYAIQAQGVDGLQPALTRIENMASLYVREVQKIQPHGPYFLCGFSMGGEIAFEMSQQLLQIGEQVDLLVMLDTKNPERFVRVATQTMGDADIEVEDSRMDRILDNGIRKRIQWHIRQLLGRGERSGVVHIWLLIQTWVVRAVIFRLVSFLHARHIRIPDSLLMLYLRTAHSKALYAYIPTHYPGKVTLFRSLETKQKNPDDSPWGWKSLADGGLEIHYFDATHNIVDEDYAEEVAHKLQECLDQARRY
jgi:thioesterase domain-containing protein/acyl carrier protein